ncbi:hypothetical protein [Streptomyces sp. NPDC126503]|uniref:hypothetical protein n=1 Tax=Streptomyces sp. NPDC126503 TaxID=3155315 RepID=UPI0033250977
MAEQPTKTNDFPDDLRDLQAELHRARAAYAALARTLPWSVEPHPGWPGTAHPHTGEITGGREPSPGYTPEQTAEEERLRRLVTDLSAAVSTHPYWNTLELGPARIAARMKLKHLPEVQADIQAQSVVVAEAA